MTLHVKPGRAVTFMKYLASVGSLIFLAKTFIWNKITFLASNSLNLAELVVNEPMHLQNSLPIFLFLFDLSLLKVKVSRAYNKRTR